ncbi:MAG: hemolysin [Alphaproteobacteria bacterium]|nr:hemolysin [Alphaproteobacteria bacterium]MBU2043053.1 hemolysin [Alphaproteobacteria bacterium]MBU2126251.1 hemolysin [Alphaproteobacteria bacterium]MBU2207809.1 hemolysin [Alphaproteobacteria bacterium]MBU2291188.1 hemolysin [Alphaproteobacteria bacterium]
MKVLSMSLAAASLLAVACAPVVDDGPAPTPPGDGPGQCRADQYQRYIGRNRSELPPRPTNEVWRVTCTTCPVTMDYNPARLNILFEESTGVIREVKCG